MKHILCLTLLAYGFLVHPPASAGSFQEPGDAGLRHDIQVLADYGAISGPVTAWPLSWDAILSDLEAIETEDVVLPNRVLPTFNRILKRARKEAGRRAFGATVRAGGAENPRQIRSFVDTPRETGEVGASISWANDRFGMKLGVTAVDDAADGQEVRPDGSQVGVDIGNWTLAASTLNRWWGPGWDGSLILSNNARPIPSLVFGRNRTKPFESKWLSWIGPWDMTVMMGQMENDRVIPDARFFGMRVGFKPTRNLEFGVSRTAIWCGETRPCDLETFGKILIGKDNLGDDGATFENEPSNQLAGFDVRWTNFWFETPVSIYGQMIGEDEAGGFPSRYLAQFGFEASGITRDQTSWRWFLEAAGTTCDVVKSRVLYGCGYRHSIYRSGYTYEGRIIGHALDNDALVVSTGVVVVSDEGNSWYVLARAGDVNRVGSDPAHTVAQDPQELASIDIQHKRMTRFGTFELGVGFERREDHSSGANTRETRGFVRWTSPRWGE